MEILNIFDGYLLSILIFLPLGVSFLMLALPVGSKFTRNVAFGVGIVLFIISFKIYLDFYPMGYMQFREFHTWVTNYGINYSLGVDGFSLIILMLIVTLMPSAYLILWNGRTKGYWISMMLIQSGIMGSLFSQDLILFYFFWETMLLPVFMIIGLFGTDDKVFSTLKVTIYTMFGSLFMLLAILYLGFSFYNQFGSWSFELIDLMKISTLSQMEKIWLFLAFMFAFAVKIPFFPFHTWLMKTYSNSPTGGVFLLSSIMAKLGVYGIVRFVLPLFPGLYISYSPIFIGIGLFGLFYFGLAALMQNDLKRMFAYSSASHLGFIVVGIFTLNVYGMMGSLLLIVAHALATGGLFLMVGILEFNTGLKYITQMGGIAKKVPVFTFLFCIMLLCIVGLPGTNGFISEFLIVLSLFDVNIYLGIIGSLTVLVAAGFMFWMFGRAILSESGNEIKMYDLKIRHIIGLVPLAFLIIAMGFYPDWFFSKVEPTVEYYLYELLSLGGAR
ncbi:MAG: NADH-quinone oxidoreductase subunit M [Proteobacteria bacterium]|nr:MAG: NADH-quinone oxidoreductase subunit M [Pseudomonadota bacterium]